MKHFERFYTSLKEEFVGRDEIIKGLIMGLLTENNLLLTGPPGTAKSMVVNSLVTRFKSLRSFTYLMTKFTRPEEIIGPISLKGLERDQFFRVLQGRLANVELAFLDEVFNSNSGCLNAILNIMNEKKVLNGTSVIDVPLIMVVGAANKLPQDLSGELSAFYDRFLLRYQVDYVEEAAELQQIILADHDYSGVVFATLEDLEDWQKQVASVRVSQEVLDALIFIVLELRQRGVKVSDRRAKQSYKLLQATAFIEGRAVTEATDTEILKHVFWSYPSDIDIFQEVLAETKRPIRERVELITKEAYELAEQLRHSILMTGMEADRGARLLELKSELTGLLNHCRHDQGLTVEINRRVAELEKVFSYLLSEMVAPQ